MINKLNKYWSATNGQEFELLQVYTENDDTWARYRDMINDREFTCRLEAFLVRFRPEPD